MSLGSIQNTPIKFMHNAPDAGYATNVPPQGWYWQLAQMEAERTAMTSNLQFPSPEMAYSAAAVAPWSAWTPLWSGHPGSPSAASMDMTPSTPPGIDTEDVQPKYVPQPQLLARTSSGPRDDPMKVEDVNLDSIDDQEYNLFGCAKQFPAARSEPADLKLKKEKLDERIRIMWPVDAKLLRGRDGSRKKIVSPPIEIEFCHGSETLRIMLVAKEVHQERGGSGFRKSHGRGGIELKCSSEFPAEVKVWSTVGDSDDMGAPLTHNFKDTSICRLPKEWNFSAFVRDNAFTVILEIQPMLSGSF